jgi:GNAT superfamily N-acetyltransferase
MMEIEQVSLSPADTGRIRACFEVMLAAGRVDHPEEAPFTEQPFTGWMTVGWDGSSREVWLATDQGQAVGWYRLDLPARENLDQGGLEIVVHPAARQMGIGRTLLQHAAGRAAGHGRTVLNGGARDGSPGEAFARAAGAKPGLADIQRMLDIGRLEKGKLARLRGPAERAAAGYSLVSWVGPVPEEFIEQAAAVYNAMADAPRDPEIAHEEWDAQRVRERINGLRPHYGMRDYTVAARHDDTGELAGVTEMSVAPACEARGRGQSRPADCSVIATTPTTWAWVMPRSAPMASAACRSVSESGPSASAMRITSVRYHSLAWMVSCAPTWFRAGRIASNGCMRSALSMASS